MRMRVCVFRLFRFPFYLRPRPPPQFRGSHGTGRDSESFAVGLSFLFLVSIA